MKHFILALILLLALGTFSFAEDPARGGTTVSTGAAAMSASFTAVRNCHLKAVRVHFSAAVAAVESLTITIDSAKGAVYDVVLLTQAMAGVADLVYLPDGEVLLEEGDKVVVTFANTDTRTWGTEISYEY